MPDRNWHGRCWIKFNSMPNLALILSNGLSHRLALGFIKGKSVIFEEQQKPRMKESLCLHYKIYVVLLDGPRPRLEVLARCKTHLQVPLLEFSADSVCTVLFVHDHYVVINDDELPWPCHWLCHPTNRKVTQHKEDLSTTTVFTCEFFGCVKSGLCIILVCSSRTIIKSCFQIRCQN